MSEPAGDAAAGSAGASAGLAGDAAVLPTVGETLLVAVCDLAPGRTAELLPAPLAPAADQAFVYIVWATLNSDFFPVRGRSFVEANIALPCHGPAGEGTWFVRAYFPWQDLVRHAVLSGWGGVQAEVEVGRVPAAVQRWVWPPQHPVGGWVARGGRREIELAVHATEPVELAATPIHKFNVVYGVRTVAGRRDVTLERHVEDVMHRVHHGSADLRLAGDAADVLGRHAVAAGYLVEFGIVHGGTSVVG